MEKLSSWTRYAAKQAGSAGDRLLAAACLVAIGTCPVAAKAPPEPGPTASASVRISVSVAKRYGLATDGGSRAQLPGPQGRNRFCLAATGGEMLTPVQLIAPPPGQPDVAGLPASQTRRLLPCGSSGRTLDAADGLAGTVIVSPE